MSLLKTCPGCGKQLWVAQGRENLTTICTNCKTVVGESFSFPPPASAPAFHAKGAPLSNTVARNRAGYNSPRLLWPWLIGGAAIVIVAVTSFIALQKADVASDLSTDSPAQATAWEAAHRDEILSLAAEAGKLATRGENGKALEAYRRIERLAAGQSLHDPALRSAVSNARVALDQLIDAAAQKDGSKVGPSPTPSQQQATDSGTSVNPTAPGSRGGRTPGPTTPPDSSGDPPRPSTPDGGVRSATIIARRHQNVAPVVGDVSDDQIGIAIQKAVDFLIAAIDNGGVQKVTGENAYRTGIESLVLYSLLQASHAVKDDRLDIHGAYLKGQLDRLKTLPIDGNVITYARSLRATALAVYNRPEDRNALKAEVEALLKLSVDGRYSYNAQTVSAGSWDNSNSQYGLLGVWAGAEAGIEVPQAYWAAVEKHWASCQGNDGQWGYANGRDRTGFAMDCAGAASLFVTHEYLTAPNAGTILGRAPFSAPLEKAMGWFEQGDHCVSLDAGTPAFFDGYNLYGLERVGLASGFKRFGSHDWYREMARKAVDSQSQNGSWIGLAPRRGGGFGFGGEIREAALLDTSYILLFLARGRHPLLFNKLRFEGPWSNRPRDAANLARYTGNQLERPINWQVVSLQNAWTDWTDCPILYLSSHLAPNLNDAEYDKLRSFALAGGLIFTHADGGSDAFNRFASALAKKLFPQYELNPLKYDHPLYTAMFNLESRPAISGISNGSRLLMVHCSTDPGLAWQMRMESSRKAAFDLGTNLFIYAAGKKDLRKRLSSTILPEPAGPPLHTVGLARIKYAGNWDPEPMAMLRASQWLWRETGWTLDIRATNPSALSVNETPIAHLTGTAPYTATDSEVKAIQAFVDSGGVLFIDACGGSSSFGGSAEMSLLPRAFPGAHSEILAADHPLLAGKADGMSDLSKPQLRYGVRATSASGLRILHSGKGHVIFSPMDVTSGFLGTATCGITGYDSEYALALMKNLVLWTEDGQNDR